MAKDSSFIPAIGRLMREPSTTRSRGQIILMYALMMTMLLGFAGLAIDVGLALAQRHNYEKLAATCVLEGAQQGDSTTWGTRATNCVTTNGLSAGVVEYAGIPQSGPYAGNNKFVELRLRNTQSTFFAKVVKVNTLPIAARAVAGGFTIVDFGLMGLQPAIPPAITNSISCNGCSSAVINGNACTAGSMDANGAGMQINGEVDPNQGFSGTPPQSPPATNVPPPNAPCQDPGYKLPAAPVPLSLTMPAVPVTIGCPVGSSIEVPGAQGNITVNCNDATKEIMIRPPQRSVTVQTTNDAKVTLLGSASPPFTGQFQDVTANGSGDVVLTPGFYDNIDVKTGTRVKLKKGLYLITTKFEVEASNATVTVVDNPADPPGVTGQNGVSMVVGLLFSLNNGNSTMNLTPCCAKEMDNHIQLYHLGGCDEPYSGATPNDPGGAGGPLLKWGASWTCPPGVPNQIYWGGSNDPKVMDGSIYSPYLCSVPPTCTANTAHPDPERRPQPNTLPQRQCANFAGAPACVVIHGTSGTDINGQVIAPTILLNGNGLELTYNQSSSIIARQPFLAE